MDLPEEKSMWKERQETLTTKDETEEPFVPATETKLNKEKALIYIEL